jgi:hypothetical protein
MSAICIVDNWIELPSSDTLRCKSVISIFRRDVDENCAFLGYHAANSGNFLPTYLEDGTYRLSRNVGKKLPLLAAW